jgi:formylglycine-generating enzyme required for sulfatase activity
MNEFPIPSRPKPGANFQARTLAFWGMAPCVLALFCFTACNQGPNTEPAAEAKSAATKKIITPDGLTLAFIQAGEFEMGDNNGDADERPAHRAQVSAFFMDTHEVTQKAYEALMQQNPSKSKGPDKPVEQVDWYHAVLFCNMRSLKEGLKPCYDSKTLACDFTANGYRLPTEAEWEYACRAGRIFRRWSGHEDPWLGSASNKSRCKNHGTTRRRCRACHKGPRHWDFFVRRGEWPGRHWL